MKVSRLAVSWLPNCYIGALLLAVLMEKEQKQVNVRVKDGDQLMAHETTINYSPTEFVLDFKCITPVQELNHSSLLVKHAVVMMSPWHMKSFLDAMMRIVKDYEKKFGEVKKPVELEKAEKMLKKQQKESATTGPVAETYFG